MKLRELGKETIGIGGSKDGTAEVYVRASDYFFYHENLCNPAPTEEATLAKAEEPAAVPAQLAQHDAPPVDEGIALLVDAVRALEARGNERVYGAAVIPMMRRLQADFDLTSSGHKSFKGLCQRVAEIGLIEIEHSGSDVHLKLVDQSETAGKVPTASGAEPVSDQPICESLRQWMEDKMKARLPSADDRMAIFQQLGEVLKAVPVIGLSELSNQISAKLKKKHSVEQQAIFKILYCLYRANSFSCSESGNQYNPIVNGFRSPVDDLKTLDICLIENNMRLYRREHKSTVDPKVWSQVFYGSDCQEVLIKEIAQSL